MCEIFDGIVIDIDYIQYYMYINVYDMKILTVCGSMSNSEEMSFYNWPTQEGSILPTRMHQLINNHLNRLLQFHHKSVKIIVKDWYEYFCDR